MTRRGPRIADTTLCLLAIASSASTERAWVLGEEVERGDARTVPDKSWAIHLAPQNPPACEEAPHQTWQVEIGSRQPSPDRPAKSVPGPVIVDFKGTDDEGGRVLEEVRLSPRHCGPAWAGRELI